MTGMEAIRAQRGMSAKIARELGLTRGAVAQWRVVPAELVPEIERITGLPRHILRPSHWDAPVTSPPQAESPVTTACAAATLAGGHEQSVAPGVVPPWAAA